MRNLIFSVIVIIILTTCAYYNTFFNAEEYFENAQKENLQADGKPSRNAIQNYNKAMKKCGIILTDYTKSKWVDDALFMMSQCLYYKQQYVQAKEKFEEVIEYYPKTEFAQRSYIYIARCERAMNRVTAFQTLRDFIINVATKKYKVIATNLLAEYYLEDENFIQAENYYNKIIKDYPESDIVEEVFFSLGLLNHKNGNYDKSNQIFTDFLRIRTDKKKKLDSRYYICYNYLLSGQYQNCLDEISSLSRKEYRDAELNNILLLKARALAKIDDTENADIIFEKIINENDKTLLAAESYFWRAEMHLRVLNNYELAIEYYNNVRSQNAQSPYVEDAVSHSAVASQIVQYNSSRSNIKLQELIDEQLKLAEYYLEVLELPDSALAVYDNIINYCDKIMLQIDSLQTELDAFERELPADTISTDTLTVADSLLIQPDSLNILPDSLVMVLEDSLHQQIPEVPPVIDMPTRRDTLIEEIARLHEDIKLYEEEFIPFTKFAKFWMLKNIYKDSLRTEEFYQNFMEEYPDNKYSFAAQMLKDNKKVEFITLSDKRQKDKLNYALDIIELKPDSARVILEEIVADTTAKFYKKAVYSLGYLHYFIHQDTTSARSYFEEVLSWNDESEWMQSVQKLYADSTFVQLDRLPYLVEKEEKLKAEALQADSLENETIPDSLLEETAVDTTEEEMIIELEDIDDLPSEGANPASGVSPRPKQ